ncbi:MAG: YdbL family protein [Lentisphaerae bacterium]|nr:YdbL family protein [Lentisphaerota bacterium]MCP4099804.1 YdbL family protein [Lentisphaerota bacterium]
MNNTVLKMTKIVICAMMLTLAAGTVFAGTREIKARMKARFPQIENFKNQGVIGENNKGYLEVLKTNADAKKLVGSENKDREAVYRAIARQQKASAELVGKRRAMMIARRAPKGHMLQNAKGKWYKK